MNKNYLKKIIFLFLLILTSFSIGCKKNQKTKTQNSDINDDTPIDLSIYEVEHIEEDNPNTPSKSIITLNDFFFRDKEYINKVLIKFDVERFYGKFTEYKKITDFYNSNSDMDYVIDGEIIPLNEYDSNKAFAYITSKYAFSGYDQGCMRDPNEERGVLDSLQKITIEEYNALDDESKKEYTQYITLNNPTNIITNTKYDFKFLVPYKDDYKNIYYGNEKYDFQYLVLLLNKPFIYEVIRDSKMHFYDYNINPYIYKYLVAAKNGTLGFLFKGTEYCYINDTLGYEYDQTQERELRPLDSIFSIASLIKSLSEDCEYHLMYEGKNTFDNDILTDIKYIFCPIEKIVETIINYKKIETKYEIINDQETINKIQSYEQINFLKYKRHYTVDSLINGVNDYRLNDTKSIFKIDILKNNYYFLVETLRENGTNKNYYIKYESTNDIELYNINKIYIVLKGEISKDMTNNIDYDIDVTIPIDITTYNDIKLEYLNELAFYIEDIKYFYDGFIIGLDNEEFNSVKDKANLCLGIDLHPSFTLDYINDDSNIKLLLSTYYKPTDTLPESYFNLITLSTEFIRGHMYVGRNAYLKYNDYSIPVSNYFIENIYSFTINENKIILNN